MAKPSIWPLVCLSALIAPALSAKSPDLPASANEAQKLVEAGIYLNYPGVELDQTTHSHESDFIIFEAIDPNPDHNADMGYFAVNVWTGDVWSTAGHCRRITSSRLTKMQRSIRSNLNISAAEFRRRHAKKPMCDAD